ncbi:hypothetical protein BMF94_1742 [Rhodotorula taiwanensis]|uniref:DUF1772-domain-containing protein n=1 Tax=Rhodotorula taiwanensis TaxID=741276 RepID=A0A2S5BEA7_9BASI|nr:hypothetical protein BMF94_1742 [Rhodotorula taiwanensis]
MATHDSSALLLVRSTATIGLGLATGLMASYPIVAWPTMYTAESLDIKDRLNLFWYFYEQGASTMKLLLPVSAALLGYASYASRAAADYMPATFVARNRKALLAAAAVLTISNIPWTIFAIMPLNLRLKKLKDSKLTGAGTTDNASDAEIDTMIRSKWAALHGGRILMTATAFLISVAELGSA